MVVWSYNVVVLGWRWCGGGIIAGDGLIFLGIAFCEK